MRIRTQDHNKVVNKIDSKKRDGDGGDCATFDPNLDSFARAEEHYGCFVWI